MGIYDRDYSREGYRSQFGGHLRMRFPSLTPMVKRLLIINVAVFFAGIMLFSEPVAVSIGERVIPVSQLSNWFGVFPSSLPNILQIWRLVSYQFLHDGFWHLAFNMLGLYFLGPTLERNWGSRKFAFFYLGCGTAGGLFYTLLVVTGFFSTPYPMIGASGAILGMLAACAILFPQFVVFFFIFPVPIRIAAAVLMLAYIANIISQGTNAGGDAAHLAGMAAGAAYVLLQPWLARQRTKTHQGGWERKQKQQFDLNTEVDRILSKVKREGIRSLTSKEKSILEEATRREQMRDNR